MKKIVTVLICMLICIAFVSCGSDKDESANDTEAEITGMDESGTAEGSDTLEDEDDENEAPVAEVSKEKINEAIFFAESAEGFGWVQSDGWKCVTYEGRIIGSFENGNPISKMNSGKTLFEDSERDTIYIVDEKGNIVFSTESLGVTGFVLPETENCGRDTEIVSFEEGYLLAYRVTESYNGVTYEIGVVALDGHWIQPLSASNPILTTECGSAWSTYSIKEIIYAGDGMFVFDAKYPNVAIYDSKANKVGLVARTNYDVSVETMWFENGRMVFAEYYPYVDKLFSITPDGTVTPVYEGEKEADIFSSGSETMKGKYFMFQNNVWCRDTLAIDTAENYFAEHYINGLLAEVIENSEGTCYFGLRKADGSYKFEPVKMEITPDFGIDDQDGTHFSISDGDVYSKLYHVYDDSGNLVEDFYVSQKGVDLSNGIIRISAGGDDKHFIAVGETEEYKNYRNNKGYID